MKNLKLNIILNNKNDFVLIKDKELATSFYHKRFDGDEEEIEKIAKNLNFDFVEYEEAEESDGFYFIKFGFEMNGEKTYFYIESKIEY